MKRILICCAAVALMAVEQSETVAQSGSRTGSYQSILSQSGMGSSSMGYAGSYGTSSYGSNGTYSVPGITTVYPEATTSYQQPMGMTPQHGITSPHGTMVQQGMVSHQGNMNTALQGGMNSAPMMQGSITNDHYQNPPMIMGGTGCSTGTCNTGVGNPAAGTVYSSPGFVGMDGGIACDGTVYAPGADIGCGPVAAPVGRSRNYFYGLNGLVFNRDFEDDVFITRNPSGDILLSTDTDTNTLGGLEFFLGSRNQCGNGWEARYWGLFPNESTTTLTGTSFDSYLTGLQGLVWPTTGEDLLTVVNRATSNTITRDNQIHNVELNLLRRGGCFTTRFGNRASFELLHGFRWFEFQEQFHWDINGAVPPENLFFDTDVRNTLLGYQIGSRSAICLGRRLAFNVGTKAGIFNNRARADQSIIDGDGTYVTVGVGGPNYDFTNTKNDIAFIGELDLGTSVNMTQCSRINIGYRIIGVSGIALAPDQLSNFNSLPAIQDIQTNGSLLLHGAYFGFEFCR
ncbi:MAG: BBP7 family outer membrane beta-barrel protein [Planctomycetota bacterium]